MQHILYGVAIASAAGLAFILGKKFAGKPAVESKTSTSLIRSI